jgi:hypothetical protein
LQTGIIQENDREETTMDGVQETIVRSWTTEEFEEHSRQSIPSISQLVGEGISRHMIPTTSSSNNVRERKLWDKV